MTRQFIALSLHAFLQIQTIIGTTLQPPANGYTPEAQADLVTSLPGLNPLPPFKMFSGYLPVNSTTTNNNIFYLFVEASTEAPTAPVVWWSNGGPGCSGLLGFGTEHGPFYFHNTEGNLTLNPYSWNKLANMLYVEQPVGVGFSYTDSKNPGVFTDERAATDNYLAIKSFFDRFPNLKGNEFYITSESYGGHYIPTLAKHIIQMDTSKDINFKGFAIGNPYVDGFSNDVAMFQSMYTHGVLPKPLYDKYQKLCSTHKKMKNNTFKCQVLVGRMWDKMGDGINPYALSYPVCLDEEKDTTNRVPEGIYQRLQLARHLHPNPQWDMPKPADYEPCAENYLTTYLNRIDVQEALHVTPRKWKTCAYDGFRYSDDDIDASVIGLYKELVTDLGVKRGLNMLIYSGDDDSMCALVGTQEWIYDLGVNVDKGEYWNVWQVDGQTAGYVTKFDVGKGGASFMLVTVHDAGHEVPTYKPKEAFEMFRKYLNGQW
eukprot:CAMPEP_0172521832 /NCGR_PEP_ID=MMETSP1066-20121228/292802_1 /TAXON_ID=671091 /ORGANISM="Coscinodiscus wailesii, Strain CCMP2513" /LENGTH=485 /DNA_ID=CAMNT_0013304793 /DNA_START=72 /DNA_END=1526 /DNA_ORIENTATION=+